MVVVSLIDVSVKVVVVSMVEVKWWLADVSSKLDDFTTVVGFLVGFKEVVLLDLTGSFVAVS